MSLVTASANVLTPNFAPPTPAPLSSATIREARKTHPNRTLIENCVDYAVHMQGALAGFDVDPTDSEYASATDSIFRARARRHLVSATRIKACTIDGLRAKAALIPIIIASAAGCLEEPEAKFLQSLATDIVRIQRASRHADQSRNKIPEPRW
jgi:hypothetical protein